MSQVYGWNPFWGLSDLDNLTYRDSVKTQREITILHRVTFCHLPFRWIYYCHSSKSIRKETGKTHLCVLCLFSLTLLNPNATHLGNCLSLRSFSAILVGRGCKACHLQEIFALISAILASEKRQRPCLKSSVSYSILTLIKIFFWYVGHKKIA